MITFFVMLRTKDPPPMFDRKPIQLVFSSRTNQATDGSLTEGNHFENCWWSYPRCGGGGGGDHIQEGFGWNKSLEGSHIPDIHVNPHEVVLGVEVHVWLEALPLADIVATHPKHWAPDGEVFTNSPDHLVSFLSTLFLTMIIFYSSIFLKWSPCPSRHSSQVWLRHRPEKRWEEGCWYWVVCELLNRGHYWITTVVLLSWS